MMEKCKKNKVATKVFIDMFNNLTIGGEIQKSNFMNEMKY